MSKSPQLAAEGAAYVSTDGRVTNAPNGLVLAMPNLVIEGEPEVTDVVLTLDHYAEADKTSSKAITWFDKPLQIHDDLWIGQLEKQLTDVVLKACEPVGENFEPQRLYFSPYAFYRKNPPGGRGQELTFDPDGKLYACIGLSRLVHPTSVAYDYAARIRRWRNGRRQIIPSRNVHLNPHAFVVDEHNNWLVPDDVPQLATLVSNYEGTPPSRRVMSALWYHEAAAQNYYIDIRWPLVTAGLEALIHIDGERLASGKYAGSTKVFVDRLLGLGNVDAAFSIPESDLYAMYDARSGLAHGQPFGTLDAPRKFLYSREEALLRMVARQALTDPAIGAIFASDAEVKRRLPLRP